MDRQLSFKIKSIEDSGEIEGFVSIYGNKDLNGDIVEPGSFTKTLQESGGEVVLLLHHDRTRPIGLARLTDEAKGLRLHGSIATDLPDGKLAHAQAKKGLLRGLSIGYRTVKEAWDEASKAYRLFEVKLFEASMVAIPANPLTLIDAVKTQTEFMARAAEDIKAGRTLSAATRKRLEAAVTEIQALLAEADALDEAADDGKAVTADEPLMHSLRAATAILRA
jgi:HK97 family phage prohead protease